MVNDVVNNLSMIMVTSLNLLEPCKKEIIEYDLEENIKNKFIDIIFLFLFQIFSLRLWSMIDGCLEVTLPDRRQEDVH